MPQRAVTSARVGRPDLSAALCLQAQAALLQACGDVYHTDALCCPKVPVLETN
jgi:hypothetical protein